MSCGSDATTLPFPSTNSNVTFTGREGLEWKFEYRPSRAPPCSFATNLQGGALEGLYSNFHSKPSRPVKVTFELVDGKGNVVASLPQDIPALDAGANQSFKLKATQTGAIAWRYKRS